MAQTKRNRTGFANVQVSREFRATRALELTMVETIKLGIRRCLLAVRRGEAIRRISGLLNVELGEPDEC